jgi:2'-5' RNA ligase
MYTDIGMEQLRDIEWAFKKYDRVMCITGSWVDTHFIAAAKGFAGTIELKNVGMFQNECDVLKFEASNPTLHACNFNLKKLPHTSSYPNYEPHSTIAYLKKGMGQRYVDQFDGITHTATPTHLVYSKQDGSKINIEI